MRNNVNTLVNKVVFALAVTLVLTVTLSSCRSKKALVKEDKTVAVPSQTAGSQSDKNRIEIIENSTVFLENAAVALVDDDEVKMRWCKQYLAIFGFGRVDRVQHRGIG